MGIKRSSRVKGKSFGFSARENGNPKAYVTAR